MIAITATTWLAISSKLPEPTLAEGLAELPVAEEAQSRAEARLLAAAVVANAMAASAIDFDEKGAAPGSEIIPTAAPSTLA